MKKYMSLLKYEFKTILKDSMNAVILVYPLIVLFITAFLLPGIVDKTMDSTADDATISLLIGFTLSLALGGFIMGVLLGFSLLENKDENTIMNIQATPVELSGYTMFKIIYVYVLAIFSNIIMVGGLKLFASDKYVVDYGNATVHLLDAISYGQIIVFALVASLIVPTIALILASIAKNKVEGFAFMKSGALFILIPMLALLNAFQDGKQYILGLLPNFWTIKPLLNEALGLSNGSDLSFYGYLGIGVVYSLILSAVCLRLFLKRAKA